MRRHRSLNHIYRLVWSHVLNGWVVVAETARNRGKGGRSTRDRLVASALSLITTAFVSPYAQAGPTGGQVVSGSGTISQSGSTTTIKQNSQNLSLNWNTFNIAPQETVTFAQPSASSIAVNRISDTNGSQILGHLNANGQLYLINPNGIVFGQGAQVNIGSLVASTLDISDSSLSGSTRAFSGKGAGSVINQGTINAANGGYVALLGNHVSNQGTITAQLGTVGLAAGNNVTLTFSGNNLLHMQVDQSVLNSLAENGGLIRADGGNVIMTAGSANALLASVVNNTGIIEARTVQNLGNEQTGTITLLGGMSAGTVNVAGTLDASAPNGGNGGFIETSAASVKVANNAHVTTLATNGLTGSWLIDPKDYTVQASGGDITGATLGTQLNSSNITIASANGASGTGGNVNINDTVTWSSHKLTITSTADININAVMNAQSNASVDLEPGSSNVNMGFGPNGFSGKINFYSDAGATARSGTGFLTINNIGYTVITALGSQGSTTASDLQGMQAGLTGHYALGANINASATSGWAGGFSPVGGVGQGPFSGVFDGLGHTINGLTITALGPGPSSGSPTNGWGLFGASSGTTRNVGLTGGSVNASNYATNVGALVGWLNSGTVYNAFSTNNVTATTNSQNIGGLVGNSNGSTIRNSYASGTVSGDYSIQSRNVGGLVGLAQSSTISNSFATGHVTGNSYVGGLIGQQSNLGANQNSLTTNSYATGSVSGNSYVGGLIGGVANYGNTPVVSNSYAAGQVTGSSPSGGLVGILNNSNTGMVSIVGSYWNMTGNSSLQGIGATNTQASDVAIGLSSSDLMQSSRTNVLAYGSIWTIYNGYTFPLLSSFMVPVTVTANNQTATYSGTTHTGGNGVSYTSYGATISPTLAGTLSYSGTSQTAVHASNTPYVITPAGLYSNQFGYLITNANGSLTINAATLTPTLTNSGVSKSYNGNTNAPAGFTPTYSFTGLASGDTGVTLTNTGSVYNSAHVAAANELTVSGLSISNIAGSNGSQTTDYVLSSTNANVAATITPLTVTGTAPTISGTTSKVYDGTTTATGASLSGGSINSGAISGDTLSINTGGIALVYNSSHVASASSIGASGSLGLTISSSTNGSQSSDYSLSPLTVSSVAASITPVSLTPTLTNSGVSKVYDGTSSAPAGFTPTYSFSGLVSGDSTATLSNTGAAYNNAHVANANSVTVSGLGIGSIIGSNSSQTSDYTLAVSSASVPATITAAPLTVSLSNTGNVTKTYDGTTAAPSGFSPTYSISGLIAGDSATVSSSATPVFNSAHVATANTISQGGLSLTSISGNGTDNSVLSDYTLASNTASTGASIASIFATSLTATLTNNGVSKTYDGTRSAPAGFTPTYSISGFIAGDTAATLSNAGAAYNNAHVANANSVTVSGLGVGSITGSNGSQASDYTLAASSASVPATITAAPLTVSLSNTVNVTKTYDGTTAAPSGFSPTYSISGLVAGDSATVSSSATPVFNSAHVATANTISQGGLSLATISGNGTDNSVLGDYTLTSTTARTGNQIASISPISLTVTAPTIGGSTTKVYDGSVAATGATLSGGSVSGTLGGDSLLLDTSGIVLNYNSSHAASASSIGASGSLSVNIATSASGSQSTDYAITLPSISSVAGSITPASLTATLSNTGVTKIYDGTTAAPAGFTPTFSFAGLVSGDTTASLSNTGANYNNAHVAGATDVTITGLSILGVTGSNGSQTTDYSLTASNASVAATISPATLTASVSNSGVSKAYDGTTAAPSGFIPTYHISGLVSGDSAAAISHTAAAYDNAHVAGATEVTVSGLSLSSIAGNNSSTINDYTLASSSASVVASITPAVLTPTLTNTHITKVYDGTTSAPQSFTPNISVTGLVSGDTSATLTNSGLAYDSAHVSTASALTVSGLAIGSIAGSNGSQLGDYALSTTTVAGSATITPAQLTVSLSNTSNVTKAYDGTASAPTGFTPTYSIAGLVSGDSAVVNSSVAPIFDATHVATASAIRQSGLTLTSITGNGSDNSVLGDYTLSSSTASTAPHVASISPTVITASASIGGTLTKVFDGSTAASAATVSGHITGGTVTGDTLALNTSGIRLNYDTAQTSASTISASGLAALTISSSSFASQVTDYRLIQPVIAMVAGTITPVPIPTSTAPINPILFTQQPGTRPCSSSAWSQGCGAKQGLPVLSNVESSVFSGVPVNVINGGVRLPDNVVDISQ